MNGEVKLPVGRPSTPRACFYRSGKACQLWLSRAALDLLGNPPRVEVLRFAGNTIGLRASNNICGTLKVGARGYLAGSGIVREFFDGVMPATKFVVSRVDVNPYYTEMLCVELLEEAPIKQTTT